MKVSNYNFIFPYSEDDTKRLFYNSLTSALAIVEDDKFNMYQNFRDNGKVIEDTKFSEDLIKGGYIIDRDLDELDIVRMRLYRSRFASKRFSLTIAPTLKCNFKCIYCYEKNLKNVGVMSRETQKKNNRCG